MVVIGIINLDWEVCNDYNCDCDYNSQILNKNGDKFDTSV